MGLFDYFKKNQATPTHKTPLKMDEAETSAQDDLLSSIRQFRDQQCAVREKYLSESNKKLAPTQQKIARAEKFMRESGLTKSFPKVVKHIWHWASWSQKESFGKYTAFEVSNIGSDKNGLNEWDVAFDYNDHRFQFIFNKQKSYYEDDSLNADISLVYNDEKVLQICCTSNLNREYYQWCYLSINHLVIGDWVHSIVEMHELIKLYDLRVVREFAESIHVDQAENLPD